MTRRIRALAAGVVVTLCLTTIACGAGGTTTETRATVASTAASPAAASAVAAPATAVPVTATKPVLPVTVADKDGRNVTITDVSRIIPLNGDIAEVVWAVGLGDNVVATDTSATFPPAAVAKPKIGYQRGLSAEGVLSLRPTLVIGTDTAGPPAVIEQIRSAGVPVLLFTYPATLEAVPNKIQAVARALGVPAVGDEVAAHTRAEIDAARARAATASSKPKVAFLYVRGSSTQQIGGRGSAADALIAAAGGVDAGVAAGIEGFKPLTPEALVTASPDVLLLLTAGLQSVGGVDGLLAVPGVAQTPAGRSRRVVDLEDQYLLGMGPRVGQALMDLVKALHPELR